MIFKYDKWEKTNNKYKRNVEVYVKQTKTLVFTFVESTDDVTEVDLNNGSFTEDYILDDYGFFINKDTSKNASDYMFVEKKENIILTLLTVIFSSIVCGSVPLGLVLLFKELIFARKNLKEEMEESEKELEENKKKTKKL